MRYIFQNPKPLKILNPKPRCPTKLCDLRCPHYMPHIRILCGIGRWVLGLGF
jgi:hypothetical protein